jgi:hypothetical protein
MSLDERSVAYADTAELCLPWLPRTWHRHRSAPTNADGPSLKWVLAHLSSDESVRSWRERTAPAVVATSALMLAAAVAAAWSTYLYWLPCRGSMLRGSIIHGYDYHYDGGQFSDACLQRMDGSRRRGRSS